ncbi:energy transducer TonB [Hymenobacter tenuis]
MKYSLIALGLCLGAASGYAQVLPIKTTFYTVFPDSAIVQEEAVYQVRRTELPGQSRLDSVFYVTTKRLVRTCTTTWPTANDTLSTTTYWRANGKMSALNTSTGAKKHQEHLTFDAEGRMRQKSVREQGKEISAECYAESGELAACPQYQYTEQMPEFPGGAPALFRHIATTIRYPREARKHNRQGRVFTTFVVDETGKARYVRVQQGVSPELDAEAVRAIESLPRFEPGRQNGEAVPVFYSVPVTFALR